MSDFKLLLIFPAFLAIFCGFSAQTLAQPAVKAVPPVEVSSEELAPPEPTGIVVVELFSSQACMFCPKADGYLNKLAEMENVIPLSCHVDYFDIKKGSLAKPFCTKRQSDFSKTLRSGPKYTPQMVINGKYDSVGYKKEQITSSLFKAGNDKIPLIDIKPADTTTRFSIALPATEPGAYEIWVAITEQPITRSIIIGKNKGQSVLYENIVSDLSSAMAWDGKAQNVTLTAGMDAGKKTLAVFAQNALTGDIIAAGQYKRPTHPISAPLEGELKLNP